MRHSLYVNLNRDGMKTLETDTDAFTTEGSFKIILENHGQPAHVHLHTDDQLAELATLEETNWYVQSGEIQPVEVDVLEGRSGGGTLEISTGYGSERASVDVQIDADATGSADESEDQETSPAEQPLQETRSPNLSRLILPGLFAAVGVLVAVALMLLVSPTAAVMLGALAVLVAIAAAGYLMTQD